MVESADSGALQQPCFVWHEIIRNPILHEQVGIPSMSIHLEECSVITCVCVFSFLMLSHDFYPWLVWCFLPVVLPRLFHDFSMLYFACCLMFHVRFLHNVWCSKHTYNFFWIPISSHNVSWFLIFPCFFSDFPCSFRWLSPQKHSVHLVGHVSIR